MPDVKMKKEKLKEEQVRWRDLPKEEKKKRFIKEAAFYLGVILVALILWRFILLNATIPTGSMENTIETGSRVMGLRCAYWFSEPERGDIIVFYAPDEEDVLFVKRLIGLPGDTVKIQDGKTFINGEPLDEPYLAEEIIGKFGPYEVPEDSYFMMGDNRNHSADARFWTNRFITKDDIVGKAYFTYWPGIHWIAD